MAQLDLVIDRLSNDIAQARLVSATQLGTKPFKAFVAGDNLSVSLHVVDVSGSDVSDVDLSGYAIRIGIGSLNARPTSGTFTLTFGANTTSALAYNIDASSLQTALNGLASVVSAGGVTVAGSTGGPWAVTFNSAGARASITGVVTGLTPTSGIIVSEIVAGGISTAEVQLIRVYAQPLAYQSSFTVSSGIASGTLNLNTVGIYEALGTATTFNSVLEVELTDGSGNVSTILQATVAVNGEGLASTAQGTSDFDTYLTTADADSRYVAKVDTAKGLTAISNGSSSVAVTFSSTFASAPVVVPCVQIPSGGDFIWAMVRDGTVTTTGFTADLSAAVPATGYKLSWVALV